MIEDAYNYFSRGGLVVPALIMVGILLWFLIGLRYFLLRRRARYRLYCKKSECCKTDNVDKSIHVTQDCWRKEERLTISTYSRTIKCLCTVAPILGLLGTVNGMVEMFASMGGTNVLGNEASVGGGVSLALITTQLGLVVAIPGMVAGRLLDAWSQSLHDKVEEAG